MNIKPAFSPSQVQLASPVPLMNTFGHAELETAAAILILGMAYRDDTWDAISPHDCIPAAQACAHDRSRSWLWNPFLHPSFAGLYNAGFVSSSSGGAQASLYFTRAGYDALAPWVRARQEYPAPGRRQHLDAGGREPQGPPGRRREPGNP